MSNSIKVEFTHSEMLPIQYAVIVARNNNKWILVRHKNRNTYEIPGGHIENSEDAVTAAKRELYEETGTEKFHLNFVSEYYVTKNGKTTAGSLFYADIFEFSDLPDYEMAEVLSFDKLPDNLTYPEIQPILFNKVQCWLNFQNSKDEIWDIYDKYRNLTRRTHQRGVPLTEGDYHLVVHIWIMNSYGEFLITKRTPNKGFPNMWESTGGSALSGDTGLDAAIREVNEETGLTLLPQNGQIQFTIQRENDFADIWLFRQDFDIAEVVLQENETCDVKWATRDEICKMMEGGSFIPFYYIDRLCEMIDSEMELRRAAKSDSEELLTLQKQVFAAIYDKYQDHETSPVNQAMDRFIKRFDVGDYYKILYKGNLAGAVFVYKTTNGKMRFHIINIKSEYENKGIAQEVMKRLEALYPEADIWELDTIIQEEKNCYLYEKMGYAQIGETRNINEKMTLVSYIKTKGLYRI